MASCFSWPRSIQLDLGLCAAVRFKPWLILNVLLGPFCLFTHLLFHDPLAESLVPTIHTDTVCNAQSQPVASSLQIPLRLQEEEKYVCKQKHMCANMFFMCFDILYVHAYIYACLSAHTYAFFEYLFCVLLDENLRMENMSINIMELFRAFYVKLPLAAAFQCQDRESEREERGEGIRESKRQGEGKGKRDGKAKRNRVERKKQEREEERRGADSNAARVSIPLK